MSNQKAVKPETVEDHEELDGKQRQFFETVFQHDQGLFLLATVAGAGKTYTITRILAELMLRIMPEGEMAFEGIAAMSFGRDDAAEIVPETISWLQYLVAEDATEAASNVTWEELQTLEHQSHASETIGTVDSVLSSIFKPVSLEIGFDEPPTVGAEAAIETLHADVMRSLEVDTVLSNTVDSLQKAYAAENSHEANVSDILKDMHETCRQQQLSVDELQARLEANLEKVYPDGPAGSTDDIVADVRRFAGRERAEKTEEWFAKTSVRRLVETDQKLYEEWGRCIERFCRLVRVYQDRYDQLARHRGIASHQDCAYWVAEYFARDVDQWLWDDVEESVLEERRERLRTLWQSRFETVIIDEAQDISEIQNSALSEVVPDDARVICGGDLKQLIYGWRNVSPEMFQQALDNGNYLGTNWDTVKCIQPKTSYRHAEPIGNAVNGLIGPLLQDGHRGSLASTDIDYTPLDPDRAGTDDPHLHLITLGPPDLNFSPDWFDAEDDVDIADYLIQYLESGVKNGQFASSTDDPDHTVMLLFLRKRHRNQVADRLQSRDVTVAVEGRPLTDCRAITALRSIIRWLDDPYDPAHTERLFTGSDATLFGADQAAAEVPEAANIFDDRTKILQELNWNIDRIADTIPESQAEQIVLDGLAELADRGPQLEAKPASKIIETIVGLLGLAEDPLGTLATSHRDQRIANIEALICVLDETPPSQSLNIADLARHIDQSSASQPVVGDNHDYILTTAWKSKGREADCVVLADALLDNTRNGPYASKFVTHEDIIALAPPAIVDLPNDLLIPGYDNILYEPDTDWDDEDAGLRWFSRDVRDNGPDTPPFVGPPAIAEAVAAKLAERYRLLYVAATRARDDLVIPVPPMDGQATFRWSSSLRERLVSAGVNFNGTSETELSLPTPSGETVSLRVSINDPPEDQFEPIHPSDNTPNQEQDSDDLPLRDLARAVEDASADFLPEYVFPSILYQTATGNGEHTLEMLLGEQLDTKYRGADEDELAVSFEVLSLAQAGAIIHLIIQTLVLHRRDSTTSVDLPFIIKDEISTYASKHNLQIPQSDVNELQEYVTETVIPMFDKAPISNRLEAAETVWVEYPLEVTAPADSLEVQILGQADFLLEMADGEFHIEELKLRFNQNPHADANLKQFKIQLEFYEYAFRNLEAKDDITVYTRAQFLGESDREITAMFSGTAVKKWLNK